MEDLQAVLAAQPVRTAALCSLILSDRLEVILITPDGTLHLSSRLSVRSVLLDALSAYLHRGKGFL